jgi:competence protein ComEC
MRRKGLHFRLQTGASGIRLLGRPDPASYGVLRRIHNHCAGQLNRFIPDRKALGLIQAMLLGDEAGFDPVLRGLYADTGIIHIISISGSHVAMLFAVIAALLQWIPGERGAWIRYGTGLLLVWLYVLVAGAPPSALRSAVMFSVVALSTLSKREGRGLNTLCSAGFILLIAEPAWLFAPGFQLSFAAVLSLMLFYQPLQRLLPVRHRPLRWIWQAVCASIAAEVLTAPIVLLYFHSFPLMFIPANILAGVMIGAGGLIGGMLVIVLSPIPPLAHALGTLLGWMLDITNHGLSGLQRLSPEAFRHLYLSTGGFILLMAGIILMAVAWLRKNRGAFLIGMFAAAALLTLNLADAIHRQRQHRLVIYNNGRQALIDEIRNSGHLGLATAQSDYHASPARDAWGAWSRSNDTKGSPYFHFGKQRLLILSDSGLRKPTSRLPVDVLILTQAARRIRIDSALHCFQPGCVVLASRVSERRCRLWADSCRQRGIRFHAVQTMGAWQLQ